MKITTLPVVCIAICVIAKTANPLPVTTPAEQDIDEKLDSCSLGTDGTMKKPCLLRQSDLSQIWFMQDRFPELLVRFDVLCPAKQISPINRFLIEIFVRMFMLESKELVEAAKLDGLEFTFTASEHGILLNLLGNRDKLSTHLEKLTTQLTANYKSTLQSESFETAKSEYIQHLKSLSTLEPHTEATVFIDNLLKGSSWNEIDINRIVQTVQFQTVTKFVPKLLSSVYIQGFVHGNCTLEEALEIANVFEKLFKTVSRRLVLKQQILPHRVLQIDEGASLVHDLFNKNHELYGYATYLQLNSRSPRDNVVAALIAELIQKSLSDAISQNKNETDSDGETKVECRTMLTNGVLAILINVLSSKEPRYVDSRVEEILTSLPSLVENLTTEELDMYKTKVVSTLPTNPQKLEEVSDLLWYELTNRFYHFDRVDSEFQQLKSVTKTDIVAYLKENLDSTKKRKLSVRVVPEKNKGNPPAGGDADESTDQVTQILDVSALKMDSAAHAHPTPHIPQDPLGNKK